MNTSKMDKVDLLKLKKEIVLQIKKYGIPRYVQQWKPETMEIKTMDDLQQMVYNYHHHSFIDVPHIPRIKKHKESQPIWDKKLPDMPMPKFTRTKDDIGHLTFYHFYNPNPSESQISKLEKKVSKFLSTDLRGLILDFRYHTGGNIDPLIYALKPLLKNSTLYSENNIPSKRNEKKWYVMNMDGQISYGKWNGSSLTQLKIPIAVIIGPHTSSSGEHAAAIFRGRPGIKSFGFPTSGDLSSNIHAFISPKDKYGVMYITNKLITTVDGTFHDKERLFPDVRTSHPISAAQKWIRLQLN